MGGAAFTVRASTAAIMRPRICAIPTLLSKSWRSAMDATRTSSPGSWTTNWAASRRSAIAAIAAQAFDSVGRQIYGNIAELNERWGNHFWSQDYQRFSQIPLPMHFGSDLGMVHHPSLNLEFLRFCSDSIVSYARRQAELIRRYSPLPHHYE